MIPRECHRYRCPWNRFQVATRCPMLPIDVPPSQTFHIAGLAVRDRRGRNSPALLSDFDLKIRFEDIVVALGDKGAGKTILSLALLGGLPPEHFEIEGTFGIAGQEEENAVAIRTRTTKVALGWLPTNPEDVLSPHRSVGAQLLERLPSLASESRASRRERMWRLLEEVGLLDAEQTAARAPHRLSDPERQRVSLALAFAHQPQFFIADDPFSSLSSSRRLPLIELLVRLARQIGCTVLLTARDAWVASRFASQVVVLCQGRAVERGVKERVLEFPAHPWTRAFLAATPRHNRAQSSESLEILRPTHASAHASCPFSKHCSHAQPSCFEELPQWRSLGDLHEARCLSVDTSGSP
ncbi:MAG: oligopeptide/dipeptide ABC transporter ATP-binding protein [Myxococcota bacterium]